MTILRNKTAAKIISVLVAIVIWVVVIVTQDPLETIPINNIPITWMNEEILEQNGLAFVGSNVETASVTVRGARSNITSFGELITLHVDVNVNAIGEQYVAIRSSSPIGGGLEIVSIRPASVRIAIEDIIMRNKQIRVEFSGDALPNTEPFIVSRHPEVIEIRGARSLVNSVAYVEMEIPYHQLSRVKDRFTSEIHVLDEDRNPIPNLTLTTRFAGVDAMLYDVRQVPISLEILGEVSEIHTITALRMPEPIRVRGTRAALAYLERIQAEPINITGVERTSNLRVEFTLPAGVTLASGQNPPLVRIEIETLANTSFEFSASEIEATGLEAGLTAQLDELAFSLIVAGDDEIIEEVAREDFRLSVDLSGLEAGTHTVSIIVTHEKELGFLKVVPGEVEVVITGGM